MILDLSIRILLHPPYERKESLGVSQLWRILMERWRYNVPTGVTATVGIQKLRLPLLLVRGLIGIVDFLNFPKPLPGLRKHACCGDVTLLVYCFSKSAATTQSNCIICR